MATVSIILRTDKKKTDGTMPLNFLIIKDRKKTKMATGISIDPKYWDAKKSKLSRVPQTALAITHIYKISLRYCKTKYLNI